MLRLSRLTFMASALAVSALLTVGCGGDGTTGPQGPAGPPGTSGDKGDKGDPGESTGNTDPQVSLITPGTIYLQRTIDVTIAGDNTKWDDSVDVDFGPDIQVEGLFVTPASIIATITIDEAAELGYRDVVVTPGGEGGMPITFPEAVLVDQPIFVPGFAGTLAQGSIFLTRVHLNDLSTPFDSAGSPDYPYVSVTSAAGVDPQVQEAQPFTLDLLTFVDVDGTTGDVDVRVRSGLQGLETESLAPKAIPISPRAPKALVEGMPNSGMVATPLETILYSFTPSGPGQIITIASTSADPNATPSFALLPPSGRFADLVSYGPTGTIATTTVDPIYIVVWDNSGASGYSFDISVSSKGSDEVEPNDACDKAQAVASLPAALTNLSLSGQTDEDWFVFDAAAADVGKVVHVLTKAGDPDTDTYIDVFSGPCNSLTTLGGPSSDADYHEDFTSKPIPAAGKIYIKVSNSPFYPYAGSIYDMDIELVQGEIEPNDTCAQSVNVAAFPLDLSGAALANETDEDWYTFTVAAGDVGSLLQVVTTPGEPNTDTYVQVYSGDCANLVDFAQSSDLDYHEALTTGPLAAGTYFVKIGQSPSYPFAGSDYNLSMNVIKPADIEPNNMCTEAQGIMMLGQDVGPLFLPDDLDEDWFTFMAAAGDVGKAVHVVTSPGDPNTDTLVEVFEGDCMNLVSLGLSSDASYHEDLVTAPITAAGPIYVKVSYSSFGFAGDEYKLNVVIE